MEGKSHLSKEEVEQYEEEGKRMMDSMLTDDSESDEDWDVFVASAKKTDSNLGKHLIHFSFKYYYFSHFTVFVQIIIYVIKDP